MFFKALLMVGWPLSIGVVVLAYPLAGLWSSFYPESIPALQILALAYAFAFVNNAFIGALTVLDRQASYAKAAGVSLVVNALLNLILIPPFGYIAAAWTTVVTEIVLVVVGWWLTGQAPWQPPPRRRHRGARSLPALSWALVLFPLRDVSGDAVVLVVLLGMAVYAAAVILIRAMTREEIDFRAIRPQATDVKPVFLKPRGATEPVQWEEIAVDAPEFGPQTTLDEAQFVAIDVETTGNAPFLVLELGAERFKLSGPLSFFDTLVDCRAPINPYAKKRHHIDRSMLIGAPEFRDARRAFLRFAQGAVLVEHSHDAFDTLAGRSRPGKPADAPDHRHVGAREARARPAEGPDARAGEAGRGAGPRRHPGPRRPGRRARHRHGLSRPGRPGSRDVRLDDGRRDPCRAPAPGGRPDGG